MNKTLLLTFLLIFCNVSYGIEWVINKEGRWYMGLELGKGQSFGQVSDSSEHNGISTTSPDSLKFSESAMVKINYGVEYAHITDIWGGPYGVLWEYSFAYLPDMNYKVSPYLEVERSIYLLGASVKFDKKWFEFGFNIGALVGDMKYKENPNPNVSTDAHSLDDELYVELYAVFQFALKHKINNTYQARLGLNLIRWTRDHGGASSLDTTGTAPYSLDVYALPEEHEISVIYLGLDYFFENT